MPKKKKEEIKHETIHAHNAVLSKSSYVVLALLIPSMVFVATLALYYKKNFQNNFNNAVSKPEVQAQDMEEKEGLGVVRIEDKVDVLVEIADDELERAKGLSGKASLGEREGKLFIFPNKAQPPFWMKDMLIDLDIIWISDGVITQIHESVPREPDTSLNDLKKYIPNDPVDMVLEVNSGFNEKFGVEAGDKVEIMQTLPDK